MNNKKRPVFLNLLQIRFPVTAIMSIGHRATGVFMSLALPVILYLLSQSLSGPAGYQWVVSLLSQPWMQLLVALYAWFLAHHLFAGIRYLLIDVDVGVERQSARRSAMAVNVAGVAVLALTLVVML